MNSTVARTQYTRNFNRLAIKYARSSVFDH
jgi:hypothetical protein